MRASKARLAPRRPGSQARGGTLNSLEVGAHVRHPGLPVPSVQRHLSPRSARDGDRHFHGQARLIEQVCPVVLGDVFFLAVFLVELEEIGRPVGGQQPGRSPSSGCTRPE